MQNHLEEFVRHFKYALSSREVFKWHQVTPPDTLTDIQRAVRFFYLQQHAFGGKVDGQTWGTATTQPPINLLRIEENLSTAHLRLSGAFIENMDWHKLMERYDRPHTLFYLDPPYLETEGYGVDFGLEQYEKMAILLSKLKGKAIISLNDHPDIRRIFAAFQMDTVPISYTVGGGGNPYQTRHTYASMMLSAGEHPMWVAKQMGHADWTMIARVYGRWMPDADKLAGSRAESIYGSVQSKQNSAA